MKYALSFPRHSWLWITLPAEADITIKAWGGVGGKGVDLYTLTNANGMQVPSPIMAQRLPPSGAGTRRQTDRCRARLR